MTKEQFFDNLIEIIIDDCNRVYQTIEGIGATIRIQIYCDSEIECTMNEAFVYMMKHHRFELANDGGLLIVPLAYASQE